MRTFHTLDEVTAASGTEIGTSDWLTVDQDRITAFADATNDHQWIHVDEERAAAGPFGGTIAHGFLTLSLLPYFAAQVFALETPGARLNYGLEKVRFPAPGAGRQPAALTRPLRRGDRPGERQAADRPPHRSRSRAPTSRRASPRTWCLLAQLIRSMTSGPGVNAVPAGSMS